VIAQEPSEASPVRTFAGVIGTWGEIPVEETRQILTSARLDDLPCDAHGMALGEAGRRRLQTGTTPAKELMSVRVVINDKKNAALRTD
jgi:hypothetical protein